MRLWMIAPVGLALVTAACGATQEQRAASGGLGGAAAGAVVGGPVGAVVGGPVGAVVGGAAGAAGGLYRDEAEEAIAERMDGQAQAQAQTTTAGRPQAQWDQGGQLTNAEVRQAQETLQQMGLYDGEIDGLYGPRTIRAVEQYQQRQGLPQTAALDDRTRDSLQQQTAAQPQGQGQGQDQPRSMDMQQRDMQQQGMQQRDMDRQERLEMQREQVQDPQVPPPPESDTGTTTR